MLLRHPLLMAEDAHWKGWALQGMLLARDASGPLHPSPEEGITPQLPEEPPSVPSSCQNLCRGVGEPAAAEAGRAAWERVGT